MLLNLRHLLGLGDCLFDLPREQLEGPLGEHLPL